MTVRHSPELVALFETYTASPTSIGARLSARTAETLAGDPLVVATGTDMAIFPGGGAEPSVQSFRISTRGFKELAAISHLGPALATLVRLRELGTSRDEWRAEAERLLASTRLARAANSEALWRDQIAVVAYAGREAAIAAMNDYACDITERYLLRVLADESLLSADDLRRHVFEATGDGVGASVPMNHVMVATFFLVGMDIGHRVMRWFDGHVIDWARAMVLVCGKAGRPTAGVTWTTNSVCATILGASRDRLPLARLYIAPHAPGFNLASPPDPAAVRALEQPLRQLWAYTRAICDLGPLMFDGYPRYEPGAGALPALSADTATVSELPRVQGHDDWRAMVTRLRVAVEDPRQLLSGCVTDLAVKQLQACDNDPARVFVPGLDGVDYRRG